MKNTYQEECGERIINPLRQRKRSYAQERVDRILTGNDKEEWVT